MRAAEIHAAIGGSWPAILAQLGVADEFLRKKAGPCPACGGTDRYTFDNRKGRGDFYCRQCGPGDGFELLCRVHNWTFADARRRVIEVAGIGARDDGARSVASSPLPSRASGRSLPQPSRAPLRVSQLRTSSCTVDQCDSAIQYLASRSLWPLPEGCALRAHASVPYFEDARQVGRYAAVMAEVVNAEGELVTLHVTYLDGGRKLAGHEPRKLLSKLEGHEGCAVRLVPAAKTLGIAEGIETALSALALEGIPTWAAINTALLSKFEPPAEVSELVIFADRDEGGLLAALTLAERLQGRVRFRVRTPRAPANDWNDVLTKGLRDG
jgi:putative DNA primase/helicase